MWNNIEQVRNSIDRFWYNSYIEVDEDYTIINWHSRYKALKELWYEKIKVNVILWMPRKEAQAYRIVDNKVAESNAWDYDNLKIEMRELWNIDDMQIFFDDIDLSNLLKEDLWQSFKAINESDIWKQNTSMTDKFNSTNESVKTWQRSNEVICPHCLESFELRE